MICFNRRAILINLFFSRIKVKKRFKTDTTLFSAALVNNSYLERINSPFPYLHFMAYEIEDIRFECNTYNVDNGNTCFPFTPYDTNDFGWGG